MPWTWRSPSLQDQNPPFQQAQDAALRFLSYRPRSEAEVRRRLSRHYPPELIERVIAALREQRYLDDVTFARYWRDNREQHRPKGQVALRQELYRLGVPRETVEEALEGFDAEANAYRAGSKLARRLAGIDYPTFRQRVSGYLQRRGFGSAVVRETVARLWRELPDPLYRNQDADEDENQSK